MYYRRRIILALLQRFGGALPHTDFQKYLFLFNQLREEPAYEFVPYKYGMFSFQSYADMRTMEKYNQVADSKSVWRKTDKTDYLKTLEHRDAEIVEQVYNDFHKLSGSALIRYVYQHYPYYAINSEIASLHLNANELASIRRSKPSVAGNCLFTIGYEGSSIERYMNILIQNGVVLLCDVRRNPISMKYGFSKKQLQDIAQKLGIDYMHIPELGIESSKRKSLKTANDYAALFEEYERKHLPEHITSLEYIHDLIKNRERVAMTCFEREHIYCHRHKVANAIQHLPGWNIPVTHL